MSVWWPKLGVVLGALSLSAIGWAEPKWWMKKEDPNSIYLSYAQGDACPGAYEDVVSGALVRARMKRQPHWMAGELVLTVGVSCLKDDQDALVVYAITVKFGRFVINRQDDSDFDLALYDFTPYDVFGFVGKNHWEKIRGYVRDAVEEALTDYLKANFDL